VVYNYEDIAIDVTSSKTVANAGESFGLSWQVPKTPGVFTLTYECLEGVAVDARTIGSDIKTVPCGELFTLGNVSGVDVMVSSEKNRFTDLAFTVSFVPTNTAVPAVDTVRTVTIVNAVIPDTVAVATSTPDVVVTPPTPEKPVATPKPTPVTPAVKPVMKPTPKPTKPVTTYTYAIPVSNPNGFTDIAAKLVKMGTLANGVFVTSGTAKTTAPGAILFEVKNIGTKTSQTFTYTVTLPNGTTYTSPTQDVLKPNERATIALGFDATGLTGTKSFNVTVTSTGETTTTNNTFTGAVTITN
jgi:hypothetical protein